MRCSLQPQRPSWPIRNVGMLFSTECNERINLRAMVRSITLWMIDELARHGYRLSPGTLYPMLHAMEHKGYLTSRVQREGRVARKLYKATKLGKQGLALAKDCVREFTGEAMKP